MALDLTGIENVEFYSGHYLDAVLESDLKAIFKRWTEEDQEGQRRAPWKALAGLSDRWYRMAEQASDARGIADRWEPARAFHAHLLEALGYPYEPTMEPLDGEESIPVLASIQQDGHPFLWIVDAPWPATDDEDPLGTAPLREQIPNSANSAKLPETTWREIFDNRIFRLDQAPRWILYLSGSEALIVERHKWGQGKHLRFDLGELLGRKHTAALRATAGLLHRDVLAPESGLCLHDSLDENSHKHAFAVSSDLKHGVRRSVELLANEAVWYRREIQKKGVFNEELSDKLTQETLTWLYRMLFLFYVEARGAELDVVPMKSDAYRMGYSLESLRDLELVQLTTSESRNGYFIHESLKALFVIVNQGFPSLDETQQELRLGDSHHDTMLVDALNSPLFDDDRLDILKNVRFRNHVLQEILQLLSLSAEKKRKTRGRISYAQLGINQLGAVYEGLLSYTGFFATEDLYEVASEKDCKQLSGKPAAEREALKTYFVSASKIGDYKEGEIVKDESERKVVHKKGTYIFRLAGRNREKSASYYTPEVLTQCLVKYALKELLWEEGEEAEKPARKKTADEILALTICEPAMGSSAFLIEAVDQLADAYLEARQEEVKASGGEIIPPEGYQREKRRVKARLATNNCYGVDLNPTAVELAKVSLWLATLHEDGKCPWFGLRLATGNSLVGARREVFKTADVTRKGTKDAPNWLGLVPEPVPLHHGEEAQPPDEVDWANWTAPPRPKGTIYHFLLPAEGMAAFDKDKVIKQLAPESVKRIKEWRKEFCKPFNKKDAERLEQISDAVDRLFAQVVRERVLTTQETSDRIPVWGEPPSAQQADLLVRDQEEVAASLEDGSSAYRRLKLAMDAWCSMWFWPIEEAGLLPDRATWLAQMELILKGQVTHEEAWQQQNLFGLLPPSPASDREDDQYVALDAPSTLEPSAERLKRLQALSETFRERRSEYFNECGLADIDAIIAGGGSLCVVPRVAERLHFHHWALRFAEVFAGRGGFDLTLGNPPWIKLEWNEEAVLSDFDPRFELRSPAPGPDEQLRLIRSAGPSYLGEFEQLVGTQSYLRFSANYPRLASLPSNLYKCFVERGIDLSRSESAIALLHPPHGIFGDPNAGSLREWLYPRLALHARFINQLKLFPIGNRREYSISVYRQSCKRSVSAKMISNVFHPRTIDQCFAHDGLGPVPGIKDVSGDWDTSGHLRRLIKIDPSVLSVLADVFSKEGTPALHATLPILHSVEALSVLRKMSDGTEPLETQYGAVFSSLMWIEKDAQREGTIERLVSHPEDSWSWVLSGPNFFVGDPVYQSANEGCKNHRDYCAFDHQSLPGAKLPRTCFVPACEPDEFRSRMPKGDGGCYGDKFRLIARRRLDPIVERTLITAIIPPGASHVHSNISISLPDNRDLALFAGLSHSIVCDFFLRSTGRLDLTPSDIANFPVPNPRDGVRSAIARRAVRLNCVTSDYEDLVASLPSEESGELLSADRRLARSGTWLTDLERRQALVELDVLSAVAYGIDVEELIGIYRADFPVLAQYEASRQFDQDGRIVPTARTAAGNPAVSLVELAATLKEQAGFDVHAEYHPDGSNTQELRKQKIRLGKKEADVLGVSERCTMADLLAETEVRWSDEDHPEGRPVRLVGLRYTDPGLEPRMERVYPTPWTRCDREADYRQAWAEFERRLGKEMPEGTAL